jgi:Protein of unknown function (DUF3800)
MKVYCDESGNTGVALLDREQHFFALASTCLESEACAPLILPLLREGQREVKYSRIKASKGGQQQLLELFSSPELRASTCKFRVTDKKYYLVAHLVDKLIEPPLHEAKVDLYAEDAHVRLTNIWYFAGHKIFPGGHWKRVLEAFLDAARQLSPASFHRFDRALERACRTTPSDTRDFAMGLYLAHGRLEEFLGCYRGMTVFDPAVDDFAALMHAWMKDTNEPFAVTHDRSKPLKHSEGLLRALMSPASTRTIGYGSRKHELPLRISQLEFAESERHPSLQLADVIAGAAVEWCLVNSGQRPRTEYHESLAGTKLPELCAGTMLPSVTPEPSAPPAAGEVSFVDGNTTFLREVGFFEKLKAK